MPKTTKDTKNKVKETKTAKRNKNSVSTTTKKSAVKSTRSKKNISDTNIKKETVKKLNKTTSKNKITTTKKVKKLGNNILAEYYDLPYRYNETIVKILYQTPNILFVYWDISNDDRNRFISEYGENFFNNTKPVLKIYNLTNNYSFEVEINDFANSWYISVNDADCEYKVELGRKTIKYEENITNDYLYISSSNDIEFPNDHILIDKLPNKLIFKNVKNKSKKTKDISTLHLIGINKVYNINNFYKKMYKDEILKELNNRKIIIPSSSSWN